MAQTEQFSHDVFVSHSIRDKPVVRKIAERLRDSGLRVWFDEWSIPYGADILAAVEKGLQHSRSLLLCMSKNSLGSDWVDAERSTALFRDPMNRERRFIPALIDDCVEIIPDALRRFRYADLRTDAKAEIEELCRACKSPKINSGSAQWKFKIEGDLNDFDKERLDKLVEQLRIFSEDFDVVLRRVDPANSVLLTFDGTVEGFDKLRQLFTRGELSRLLGENVISVQIDGIWTVDDIDSTALIYDLIDKASHAYRRRDLDSALNHYQNALDMAKERELLKPIGSIYCNIGFIHEDRDEFDEATRMHRAAIEADERTANNKGLANHCYNLGRIYRVLEENEISQHYFRRALMLARQLNDSERVSEIERLLQ